MQNHGLEFNRTKYSLRKRNILRKKFYFDCKINKYLTAVSQEQTDFIREHFHKDCRTISCAVNIPQETSKSDVLERFGIIPNNYIVFMGRLVQDKNPDYLIKGFMNSQHGDKPVSYTHLTLPTKRIVKISGVAETLKKKKTGARINIYPKQPTTLDKVRYSTEKLR